MECLGLPTITRHIEAFCLAQIPSMTMLQFILLGLLTAAIGEWQFSVFLRADLDNFIGSLLFNALYMTGVYSLTRVFLGILRQRPYTLVAYTAGFGSSGLMIEWFLIGNSPWGNPQASQVGMFAYWSCMALVPLIFLLKKRLLQTLITRYAFGYTLLILLGQFAIPSPEWRFAFHIYAVIFGYLGLMISIVIGSIRNDTSQQHTESLL